jgi:predicted RecA/RadA family phage recombinase
MPMSRSSLSGEAGFTLIEALVAMVSGLIVVAAAFAILQVSLRQTTRIADKVSADQRGRMAMEKIMLELHSSCVSNGANPILVGSEGSKLIFESHTGTSEPFFTSGLKHIITLEGTTLVDRYYQSTTGVEGKWRYPAESEPTKTVTILTNVYAPGSGTMFEYFKYTKLTAKELAEGKHVALNQILAVPLSAADAKSAAKVNVNFNAAPDTNNTATGRVIAFNAGAVLRLTPATDTGANEPCE